MHHPARPVPVRVRVSPQPRLRPRPVPPVRRVPVAWSALDRRRTRAPRSPSPPFRPSSRPLLDLDACATLASITSALHSRTPSPPRERAAGPHSPSPSPSTASPDASHAPSHEDVVRNLLASLPSSLRSFAALFSAQGPNTLPPHRPGVDLEIELIPGAPLPRKRLYSLSAQENELLRRYIDEMLAKGFIRPSRYPVAWPFLYAAKKGGELRPCVDFRLLNNITVKNSYPIPLTQQLVDRVQGCKFFSKIDLKNAYNLLRIAAGHEWKTTFNTRFGLFEYLVMPFGLTNAPAAFQAFIQHVLRQWLDVTVVVYLDDILIFTRTQEEHEQVLKGVFQALLNAGLYANPKKCEFFVDQTEFLGFILSTTGLAADPAKLQTIRAWPAPRTVTEVRAFLGHAGFYRRFIDNYSQVALPLTRLTRTATSPTSFVWDAACQRAFDELKRLFTSPPSLRHFDFEQPSVLFVDASDFALGAVLAQADPITGVLHPCAFYSRQFTDAEINYKIYDKELCAIVAAFRHWRAWLIGSKRKVTVLSDHRNLEYFTTTRELNRRQAGWSELLQDYNFTIVHVPGARNWADGPSRRPDYAVRRGDFLHLGQYQILLDPSILTEPLRDFPSAELDPASSGGSPASRPPDTAGPALRNVSAAPLTVSIAQPGLFDEIRRAADDDPVARAGLDDEDNTLFSLRDGIVTYRQRVYVPAAGNLRQRCVAAVHDSLPAGHCGPARTLELLQRTHDFPGSRRFVYAYVRSCDTCQRSKAPTHAPYGLLKPLSIPSRPWSDISMDFITKLPVSWGFDSVWVVVDRFTKMAHFVPCHETVTAPQLAWLFLQHIFRLHGLPRSIVSDRGSVFTSQFWYSLFGLLGTEARHSTAYHPQTDGQTERVNALLENYLRSFTSYQQDDWSSLLPFAEFSYNNSRSATTQQTPFMGSYGFHPSFLASSLPASTVPAANDLVETLRQIHAELRLEIQHAQTQQQKQYDRHRLPAPVFAVGQQVWLLRRNIRTTRPSDKLDHKRIGPFRVAARFSENAYRLVLPATLSRLHPVFNVQLLEPYTPSPGSMSDRPTPQRLRLQLSEGNADELPWRPVQQILDVRQVGSRYDYLVRWYGLDPSEDSWRSLQDLSTSLNDLLRLYHHRNPSKPCPPSLQARAPVGPPRPSGPMGVSAAAARGSGSAAAGHSLASSSALFAPLLPPLRPSPAPATALATSPPSAQSRPDLSFGDRGFLRLKKGAHVATRCVKHHCRLGCGHRGSPNSDTSVQ